MASNTRTTTKGTSAPRPPVVAVMGHIDHGKSTLLDFIRKTNLTEKEAGGITQHVAAYEVVHKTKDGTENGITFLDTPGHEAFRAIRARGASVADVAVLVVSGEDGVKPQTLEALQFIKQKKLPYVVAITKIDKPTANVERTKQSMAEHEIYVEGYGGDIPCVPLSSKTGDGVDELLDMILLLAEMHAAPANIGSQTKGFVIEARMDKSEGISATLIITEGLLKKGDGIAAEGAFAPVRGLENFLGKNIEEAGAGRPVRVIGWNSVPRVGAPFEAFATKKEAESRASEIGEALKKPAAGKKAGGVAEKAFVPLVVKADVSGTLEAIEHEAKKLETEKVAIRIIHQGVGTINESDLKAAMASKESVIAGFNVAIDQSAKAIIEREGVPVKIFDVIYRVNDWLSELIKERTPKIATEEPRGSAKILKIFTTDKDRQIVGGKVLEGAIGLGQELRVLRREAVIGKGRIKELQQQKKKEESVASGNEFGALVSTNVEIAPGDRIETYVIELK